MTRTDIAIRRLVNQRIAGSKCASVRDVVRLLGAVQAQDYAMAKWAIGLRTDGATDASVEKALDDGTILRTHVLRPTWHIVPAGDLRWMLDLSAPRINRLAATNFRKLELDEKIFRRSNRVIGKALRDGRHLTRAELMTALDGAGINTGGLRAIHLMFRAELDGLVCNGPRRGKQFTYALLDERVPRGTAMSREESLAELARRYFTSHGPATVHDFAWWSGLTVADATAGIASMERELESVTVDGARYRFVDDLPDVAPDTRGPHLLPAFDEFMVAYRDRTASLDPAHTAQAITGNGIFRPIVVVDGKVVGTWKRTAGKGSIVLETAFLNAKDRPAKRAIVAATRRLEEFTGMPVDVAHGR